VKITKVAGKIFDNIILAIFWIAGMLLFYATIGTCIDAILRYFLNRPIPWMLEITEYIMLYIPFLGAAFVLREEGHIKVDLLINHLSDRNKNRMGVITSGVGGIVMVIYTWFGAQVTLDFFKREVPSLEYLKTPMYLILMIIPIGSFFFSIQFLRQIRSYYRKMSSE
jgi:TRAP-type C4-dicarboxylate transport system permease small subunit